MSQMVQFLRGTTARHVLIRTTALFLCLGFPHNAQAEWHVARGANTWTGQSREGLLPHVEQKSPRNNSSKIKGSERGVIAIIKPGEAQLPYIEQKSPRNNSGKTKGGERGVTFGGIPGGQSPLNFRMPGGSMSGIGSIGAHGFRAR